MTDIRINSRILREYIKREGLDKTMERTGLGKTKLFLLSKAGTKFASCGSCKTAAALAQLNIPGLFFWQNRSGSRTITKPLILQIGDEADVAASS